MKNRYKLFATRILLARALDEKYKKGKKESVINFGVYYVIFVPTVYYF